VRSKEEILRTLDHNGQLEGMPFMPEMLAFCGKRFRVFKRAHKACDTVFPTRSRRVHQAVHLETRCDGRAHGGCQAGCLIFWKEAWLKPVEGPIETPVVLNEQHEMNSALTKALTSLSSGESVASEDLILLAKPSKPSNGKGRGCTETDVWAAAKVSESHADQLRYTCQATQLPYATTNLSPWDIRQYIEDYGSGNVTTDQLFKGAIYSAYYNLSQAGIGLGRPMRWFYEKVSWLWGGARFPRTGGTIPVGDPTPAVSLNLQPGELVRVKSHDEILRTITAENKNRGMSWDAEMVPYCGGTYRVLTRVSQIIDERTGRMQTLKNPCIILDNVVCQAKYSGCRMFCPRSIYPYWREIWLERVTTESSPAGVGQKPVVAPITIDSGTNDTVNGQSDSRGLVEIGKE
jgi:hypothetical protein